MTTDETPSLTYIKARDEEHLYSDGHSYGLRIYVALGRELTANDEIALCKASNLLEELLMTETMRLDPNSAPNAAKLRSEGQTKGKLNSDIAGYMTRTELLACFPPGSFAYAKELPNGYCSQWCCSQKPWFEVHTIIGIMVIGWRKRVISIDWSRCPDTRSAEDLFPEESVTKLDKLIHAWSLDDARRYLAKIVKYPE